MPLSPLSPRVVTREIEEKVEMSVRERDREKEKRNAVGKSRGLLLQEGEGGSRTGLVEREPAELREKETGRGSPFQPSTLSESIIN